MSRFQKFMQGRNGGDQLNLFLIIVAMITMVVGLFFMPLVMDILTWALLIWSFFRMFSKNVDARRLENYKFCAFIYKIKNWFKAIPERAKYRYYKCPQCSQKVRVPRGLGKIQITCPKCGTKFTEKT